MNLHRKHASTKLPALGAGGFTPDGLLPDELEAQDALALPDRKALSVISTLPDPQALLDLYADINLGLDLAAPVAAALAANLNIALPINASVSANVLSPDSISLATAKQGMIIPRSLDGTASATADQVSQIDQGEAAVGPTGSEIPSADPVAPEAPAASMAPGGE